MKHSYELEPAPSYAKNGFHTKPGTEHKGLNGTTGEKTEAHEEAREEWSKGLEFFLSCLSISIGLGNVWRFPTLAYQNGGGAFLLPYFFLLFVVAKPLYYLELAFGQFANAGPAKVWSCVPALKGIGYAQLISTFYVTVFYNYIMALCLFYVFASMQQTLPWTYCDPEWSNLTTCYSRSKLNFSLNDLTNDSVSSAEFYFNNYVLKDSGGLTNISSLDWRMSLCLLLSWTLVTLATVKGVKSLGKVVYLTSTYPYVVMIGLLVVALLREGSFNGLKQFFIPEWEKLADIEVWFKACEQSFFSLNTGFGHLIMYASYNTFRHKVGRDAFYISIIDTLTSILAGCVVYATLGTLAFDLGETNLKNVIKGSSDLGLAFITYPEALGRISIAPQLWSVLFFLMLYLLGLGSAVGHIEMILTLFKDDFPSLRQKQAVATAVTCSICFLTGLVLCTDSGSYVRLLFDNYGVGKAVFLYAILEVVGLMWVYGWKNICKDFHFMFGSSVSWFWKICWSFITPVTLIGIFIYGNINFESSSSEAQLPKWGRTFGWILAAIAMGQIVTWFLITWNRMPGSSVWKKLCNSFSPEREWGPRDPKIKQEWALWKSGKSQSSMPLYTICDKM